MWWDSWWVRLWWDSWWVRLWWDSWWVRLWWDSWWVWPDWYWCVRVSTCHSICDDVCRVGVYIAISHIHPATPCDAVHRIISHLKAFSWATLYWRHFEGIILFTKEAVPSQDLSKHHFFIAMHSIIVGKCVGVLCILSKIVGNPHIPSRE